MGRSVLLPERRKQKDFFIADIFDGTSFKDDMASMEHPFFTLSTKRDVRDVVYENDTSKIEIKPTSDGLPNIFDKDVLLYCVSALMEYTKQGEIPPKTLRVSPHDILVATNRTTDGKAYISLKNSLERLHGTSVYTTIKAGRYTETEAFHLIEHFHFIESSRIKDRFVKLEITVADWLYNSVLDNAVLTIHPDYFRLRKPLERRMYELARKHCGNQKEWKIGLEKLQLKTGSKSAIKLFRLYTKRIVEDNPLPEYRMAMDGDIITFYNREKAPERQLIAPVIGEPSKPDVQSMLEDPNFPKIADPDTLKIARGVAPGYDIDFLYNAWLEYWDKEGRIKLAFPDSAFLKFCQNRFKMNPRP